jgi:hypothetical protein
MFNHFLSQISDFKIFSQEINKKFILLFEFFFINAVSETVQLAAMPEDQTLEESKETTGKQIFHKLLRELLQNVYSFNKQTDLPIEHRKSSTETAAVTLQQYGGDVVHSPIQQSVNVNLPEELERRIDSKTHVLERMNVLLKQLQNDLLLSNDVNQSTQSLRPSSQFQVRLISRISCYKSKLFLDPLCSVISQPTPSLFNPLLVVALTLSVSLS